MSRRVLASLEAPPAYRRESMEEAISDGGWIVVEFGGTLDVWERDGDRLITRAVDGAVTVFRRCTPAELARLLTPPVPAETTGASSSGPLFDAAAEASETEGEEEEEEIPDVLSGTPVAADPLPVKPAPKTRAERDAQREADRAKFPEKAPF